MSQKKIFRNGNVLRQNMSKTVVLIIDMIVSEWTWGFLSAVMASPLFTGHPVYIDPITLFSL